MSILGRGKKTWDGQKKRGKWKKGRERKGKEGKKGEGRKEREFLYIYLCIGNKNGEKTSCFGREPSFLVSRDFGTHAMEVWDAEDL